MSLGVIMCMICFLELQDIENAEFIFQLTPVFILSWNITTTSGWFNYTVSGEKKQDKKSYLFQIK